jgi:hypothetical protein
MPVDTLTPKGLQTRQAIEQAARKLFENFTTVFVGTSGLGFEIGDEDAIAILSRIWKKTLYGF